MRNLYLLIIVLFIFTSCATLMNKRSYRLAISSNAPKAKVKFNDSVYNLPAQISVLHSKTDLELKLIADTIIKSYIVKSSVDPEFLYGNLVLVELAPIGYLVDLQNNKRFYYGKSVLLDINDTTRIIKTPLAQAHYNLFVRNYPARKGQINLLISVPFINSFYFQPTGESSKRSTGFWGLSAGLEYFYNNRQYLSLSATAVIDNKLPVPVAVEYLGPHEGFSSTYISLTNNHKLKHFIFGYGLNYSKNVWDSKYYYDVGAFTSLKKTDQSSLGLTLNVYHQFSKSFFLGLIYRPTLFTVSPQTVFKYEHLVSLDFAWKIRLKK